MTPLVDLAAVVREVARPMRVTAALADAVGPIVHRTLLGVGRKRSCSPRGSPRGWRRTKSQPARNAGRS